MRRVQWHVLTTLGLPPMRVARHWVKIGGAEMGFVPPPDMIERYIGERVNVPLPDGKLDQRITNGGGRALLNLAEELGPRGYG